MQETPGAIPGPIDMILGASAETTVVLVVCALCSLASWYIIGAKWFTFRRLARQRAGFDQAMERARTLEERTLAMAGLGDSPFAQVVRTTGGYMSAVKQAMEQGNVSRSGLSLTQLEALTMSLDREVRQEADAAGRMIPWLATIGATAPLLGLFGTVLGIMKAFTGLGTQGAGDIATVAPGIADALIATAAGLGAAIPAVVAYNIFTARTERFEGELERTAQEQIALLGREGRL